MPRVRVAFKGFSVLTHAEFDWTWSADGLHVCRSAGRGHGGDAAARCRVWVPRGAWRAARLAHRRRDLRTAGARGTGGPRTTAARSAPARRGGYGLSPVY